MKALCIFYLVIASCTYGFAQTFVSKNDTVSKSKSSVFYKNFIKKEALPTANANHYLVDIVADANTTCGSHEYIIHFDPDGLEKLEKKNNMSFIVEFLGDTQSDRTRNLKLNLILKDTTNNGKITIADSMTLTVQGIEDPVDHYRYLAYVGTNFDLVDGIEANNLFFASNVFLEPTQKKWGWYLSLYGNRSLSSTDSIEGKVRTTRRERIHPDSILEFREVGSAVVTRVSDNLGAHVSALYPIAEMSHSTQLSASFSTEFIWRRTKTTTINQEGTPMDTIIRNRTLSVPYVDYPDTESYNSNEFSWNIGPGLVFSHQTKKMSVRLHASAGYISQYLPRYRNANALGNSQYEQESDVYFLGRAWITEATSGITLQAEVTNTLFDKRPFYTVTLSKAINFSKLGNIFSPITSR